MVSVSPELIANADDVKGFVMAIAAPSFLVYVEYLVFAKKLSSEFTVCLIDVICSKCCNIIPIVTLHQICHLIINTLLIILGHFL